MAGDWIKMRGNLRREPKVLAMSRFLSEHEQFQMWYLNVTGCDNLCDVDLVTRVTVAALLEVWHCVNESLGREKDTIEHMSVPDIDMMCGVWGMGDAMRHVGWVEETANALRFPDFREHNTPSKERRESLTGAERTARWREKKAGVTSCDAGDARKEKKREEKKDIQSASTAVDDAPAPEEPKTTPPYPPAFETWWQHYPRKVGKRKALAAWKRARKTVGDETLLTAVCHFARSEKGRGEYCPHPTTWLNEGRYEDDPTEWTEARAATAEERGRHLPADQEEREKEYRRRRTAELLAQATPTKDDDGNGLGDDWRKELFQKVDDDD